MKSVNVRVVLTKGEKPANLYVTPEGRVKLAGDLLDITDRLSVDVLSRVVAAAARAR